MVANTDSPTKAQVEMKFRFILAQFDLVGVAKQVVAGDSLHDALRKVAAGDFKLPDSPALTAFKLVQAALLNPVPMEPPDKDG